MCCLSIYVLLCFGSLDTVKIESLTINLKIQNLKWTLTILTTLGVCALLAPGLIVWNKYVTVPDEAEDIEVMAQQWYWNYRLPGEDGILGLTDLRNINEDNPLWNES